MSLCICHHRRIGSDLLLVNLTHAGRSFCLQWLGEEVFRRWRHYYSQPAQPLVKAHLSQFEVQDVSCLLHQGKNCRLLWLVLMMTRVERGDTGKKGTKAQLEGLKGRPEGENARNYCNSSCACVDDGGDLNSDSFCTP